MKSKGMQNSRDKYQLQIGPEDTFDAAKVAEIKSIWIKGDYRADAQLIARSLFK
tara:strand:+ start:292 stop:453 length:162 start_codon:yes stop_codon:yes gene_type:complete